jgi:uncharacterized protein (TIGR03435 family)
MKRDKRNVDEILRDSLPSASREQIDSALDRVFTRLQSDGGWTVPEPAVIVDSTDRVHWWWRPALATAAVLLVAAAAWIGLSVRNGRSYAVLQTADALYRIGDRGRVPVRVGERIRAQETVETDDGNGAMLTLADGSRVEMRAQSQLAFEQAVDGVRIRLRSGSIIVNAAKQPAGHLYVQTNDVTVAVVGTVFLVNAAGDGSRVAVIQGEVRVQEGKLETRLRPGEQVSTSPTLAARPLKEEIAWSRQKDAHLAILAAFEKGMAATSGPRTPVADTSAPGQAAGSQPGSAAATPEFEEASIRPCDPDNLPPAPQGARGGGANSFQMTPGRTHVLCMTLATLIRTAYGYSPARLDFGGRGGRGPGLGLTNVYGLGVEDGSRVRGGPDWVRNDHYTIDAVADGAADAATMSGPMLRALLERRFQLETHIETEQIPAFALTVAGTGLKMKEGTCTPPDASFVPLRSTAEMVRKNLEAARRGATTAAPCGFAGTAHGPNMLFVGAGAGVPPVGAIVGAPVIDRTGIPNTARFNYVLEFAPDEASPGPLGRGLAPELQPSNEPSDVPRAASIFTALEEQLGLKLEPARAPREFIVIDRVERPTAN